MSDDVITDDFDVEVFLDLLHWSWEDAFHGTHEPERPVSPFSPPAPSISDPGAPQTEPMASRSESDSSEERRLSLDSQVSSSFENLAPPDRHESFGISHFTAILPASDSLSSGRSSQSTITHDLSPKADASKLKRSASGDTDVTVPGEYTAKL